MSLEQMSDDLYRRVLSMWRAGQDTSKIARTLGVPESLVWNEMGRRGRDIDIMHPWKYTGATSPIEPRDLSPPAVPVE